ncbi:MAG: PorT family protein [Bacteroidales bacterium]|nr:PorT family protein [Bacteroidales bacterium]MCF8457309.1 PorT family protein [Bacteroidales bacterium]
MRFSDDKTNEYQLDKNKLTYSADSVVLEKDGLTRYFYPSEIKSIKTDKLLLVSKDVSKNGDIKRQLLEPIIEGTISLYQSRVHKGEVCYYLQKGDSIIYALPKKYFVGFINLLFADCEELNITMAPESMNKYKYNLRSFFELVHTYNGCFDPNAETVIYKVPKVKFKSYLTAGIAIPFIKIDSYPYKNQEFSKIPSPYFGGAMGFEYFKTIGLYIGVDYSKIRSKSSFTATGVRFNSELEQIDVDVDIDLDYSFHLLKLPFTLQIKTFPSKRISPFFEIGASANAIFLNKSTAIADDDYTQGVGYTSEIFLNDLNISKFFNVGLEFKKYKKPFSLNFGMTNTKYSSTPITNYGFSVDMFKLDDARPQLVINQFVISLRMFL